MVISFNIRGKNRKKIPMFLFPQENVLRKSLMNTPKAFSLLRRSVTTKELFGNMPTRFSKALQTCKEISTLIFLIFLIKIQNVNLFVYWQKYFLKNKTLGIRIFLLLLQLLVYRFSFKICRVLQECLLTILMTCW